MDFVQLATQLALMAIGSVTTWAFWVTKRHLKLKQDLNAAFIKIRNIERELENGRRLNSKNRDRNNCEVDD